MRWISSLRVYRKLNGLWFDCTLQHFPEVLLKGDTPWRYDFAEARMVCRAHALEIYRDDVFCVHKRQLSSRELRRLGLQNELFPSDSAECAFSSVSY
jgi:hypothetical protein